MTKTTTEQVATMTPIEKASVLVQTWKIPEVPGLTPRWVTNPKSLYLGFFDAHGVMQWKVLVDETHNGRVRQLRLYHRNRWGRSGFHSQHRRSLGNKRGLRELVEYIQRHDAERW